ncbi:MAG: pilus assembly protein PilM [Caldimicrobium sp.]
MVNLGSLWQKLSKFTSKISNSSNLGLDVGTYSLKLAEISIKNNRPVLEGFSQAKVYENTIINKLIQNSEILKTVLKNQFQNFSPKTHKIFYALPHELTLFGNFNIDNPNDLHAIKKQIDDEIPYQVDDVYYSYFTFPEKNYFIVYYLVSKKDNIDLIRNILAELNYSVENINVDSILFHNFLEFLYGQEEKLIIDWGETKINLHFTNKDLPIFTRELFKLGIKQIKKEVMSELKVPLDIAEKMIHNTPDDERKSIIKKILINYIKSLVEEIQITIDLVQKKYNVNPTKFYLVGGGARIGNILKILSELLKVNFQEIKIEEKIGLSDNIDRDYLKIINTQGVLAVAAAVEPFI